MHLALAHALAVAVAWLASAEALQQTAPRAAPPPPPPCPVATPLGFKPAPQEGYWADPSCPVDPATGEDSCAMPSIARRHGVSVECCAQFCAADPACQGFQVFEPCGISDCYAYRGAQVQKNAFTPRPGTHSFTWSGARPPAAHNTSAGCATPSWNPGFPFAWKCRVVGVAAAPGPPPAAPAPSLPGVPARTTWALGSSRVASNGTGWSATGNFTAADAAKAKKFASVVTSVLIATLSVGTLPSAVGAKGSLTSVECQITLLPAAQAPMIITAKGLLFGGTLGLMLSTSSARNPRMSLPVLTMAEFNTERYGPAFAGIAVATPPRKFPVVDRCIGGDSDWNDWNSCVRMLGSLGVNAIGTADNAFDPKLLAANGIPFTSDGIYAPPGAEPDTGATLNSSYMARWAAAQFTRFRAAGFKPTQLAAFALADEPGWYFPSASPERVMNASVGAAAAALKAEWAAFLSKNKVAGLPMPLTNRWQLKGLAAKKLFYWSSRFSSYSSAAAFARATAAIEGATVKGAPVYVNFNNFAGRGYVPGPVGNNRDRTDPNAAMVSIDWFEFGRARGSTLLWTEDWFRDSLASQWGYYGARLRSASRLAPTKDVAHGGYIVPRAGGDLPDGLLMKMMAIVGSGGKAIYFYAFGPEYNFPGNCYSEHAVSTHGMLPSMAKGTGMIGQAEELLYPAERVASEVGIVYPRSAFYWDEQDVELPRSIMDCTNSRMTDGPDYLREVYMLYRALAEILNVGVDFLDEDELLVPASLAKFKVLYVTTPDLPLAGGAALVAWVKAGGTLITVAGAGQFDEYDEPSAVFQTELVGSLEAPKARDISRPALAKNGSMASPPPPNFGNNHTGCAGSADPLCGRFQAWGTTTRPSSPPAGEVLATFDDKAPAVVANAVGRGRSVHFYFFPGTSFFDGYTADGASHRGAGGMASQWTLLGLLCNLTTSEAAGGVAPPVTTSSLHVEAPLLAGPAGSVVTLLNWLPKSAQWHGGVFNASTSLLTVEVALGFAPSKVRSVEHGALAATPVAGKSGVVSVTLPLAAADFLLYYK